MIHGHGNDIHSFKGKIKADFSSNVWFEGPSPKLLNAISTSCASISNYPEPDAASLAKQIEYFYQLPDNSCLVTNGSVEGFYLIAQALKRQSSTIFCPTFAEYEDACCRYNYNIELLSNQDIVPNQTFESDLIWLCNPNNPDGKVTPVGTIQSWLKTNPKRIFIIDEAYAELCYNFDSAIPLLEKFNNLIIVKSFTKAFAIPGLRLGFLLANNKTIQQLKAFQLPWAVNALAITAGEFILNKYKDLLLDQSSLISASKLFQQQINNINGFDVTSSKCNYFLVKGQKKASDLKAYLIKNQGILIRDASNFRGLSKQHFRVAIQSPEKNSLLVSALKQWSNS